MKQLSLLKPTPKRFGGELLQGRRKALRPLATNCPIHLVMHSSNELAKGGIFRHRRPVEKIIQAAAKKWNIKIQRQNVLECLGHIPYQPRGRGSVQRKRESLAASEACGGIKFP